MTDFQSVVDSNHRGSLFPFAASGVALRVEGPIPRSRQGITVDRAEFIAAVEAELDVIIIEKKALPATRRGIFNEVIATGHVFTRSEDPDAVRVEALALLAIEQELRANPPKPPLDPEQVRLMRDELSSLIASPLSTRQRAEELIRRGWTHGA